MGNAIGSCLFNTGAIFGLAGMVTPPVVPQVLVFPLVFMGVLGVALLPISRTCTNTVSRLEGGLLLAAYGAFLAISAVLTLRSV